MNDDEANVMIDSLASQVKELLDALAADHHATGGICPVCPGENSRHQSHCTHKFRGCETCQESWPCRKALRFQLPGTTP